MTINSIMYEHLKQQIASLQTVYSSASAQHISISGHAITFLANRHLPEIKYIPEATPDRFHSSQALVRLMMGCYGSGKTSAAIAEIILLAARMPVCIDGIRRARCAIIRNTYGQLETTTIKSWDDWTHGRFSVLRRSMKAPIEMCYHIKDDYGTIELELLFLSLNRDADIGKIKSLETTFAFINEACELPFSLVTHLIARTGRYPAERFLEPGTSYRRCVFMDTNPPSTRHPIYDAFEVRQLDGYEIFKQPAALLKTDDGYVINPAAENIKHHSQGANYYLDMVKGATEEYIKVYAMGEYGIVRSGKLVYPNYNDDLHSLLDIEPEKGAPVVVGWDFGTLASGVVIAQVIDARLCVIKEFVTDREGFESFASNVVIPYIYQTFPGSAIMSIGDPSGIAENYVNMSSGIKTLNQLGFPTKVAKTNRIKDRIDSVSLFLNRMVVGKPALLVSRKGCPILREGFLGMYKYRTINVISEMGERKTSEEPDKTHPHSEPQDCLQYICMDYNIFLEDNTKNQVRVDELISQSNSMWA